MAAEGPVEKELKQMFYYDTADFSCGDYDRMKLFAVILDKQQTRIDILEQKVEEQKCQLLE